MAMWGDHYAEEVPLRAVDYMIEQVRQSSVGNTMKNKAIKALKKLDKEGRIIEGTMELIDGFYWDKTDEGAEFWGEIQASPEFLEAHPEMVMGELC